jgi:protein gp37
MEKRFQQMSGTVKCHPDRLSRFNTRKPKVFSIWNDLFHLSVPFSFIDEFHKVNMNNLHNTVLILTKRPERMKLYYQGRAHWEIEPNIYKGLTVVNQQEMEDKSEVFFSVPGNKFLSLEPLLSKVIIPPWVIERKLLKAVILGGETGPGARPLHPDWVRAVRNQCAAAGVPFFFKQWGEWLPVNQGKFMELVTMKNSYAITEMIGGVNRHMLDAIKVGRKKAGRLLDGQTHDVLPWVKV